MREDIKKVLEEMYCINTTRFEDGQVEHELEIMEDREDGYYELVYLHHDNEKAIDQFVELINKYDVEEQVQISIEVGEEFGVDIDVELYRESFQRYKDDALKIANKLQTLKKYDFEFEVVHRGDKPFSDLIVNHMIAKLNAIKEKIENEKPREAAPRKISAITEFIKLKGLFTNTNELLLPELLFAFKDDFKIIMDYVNKDSVEWVFDNTTIITLLNDCMWALYCYFVEVKMN